MLPIVKRKALEVPHGLAAAAAAICLVLAFATDLSDREQAPTLAIEKPAAIEFVAKQAAGNEDQPASADSPRHQGSETGVGRTGASPLINWFGLRR